MRIKNKLCRHMAAANTMRWIDELQSIIDSLNSTFMVSIGTMPKSVTFDNEREIFNRLYNHIESEEPKFKVGDRVRLVSDKGTFGKGTRQRYTEEVFTIVKVIFTDQKPCYVVEDYNSKEIDAFFYPEELQIYTNTDQVYAVEKVIRKRIRNGKKQCYVKWRGYDRSFNQWVDAAEVEQITSH